MNRINKANILVMQVIPGLLMLLFFYTAFSKLMDYPLFKAALGDVPFISRFANILAWLLPVTEIIAGGLLFHPSTRKIGLLLSLALLIVFTAYLFGMVVSGIKLPCNCGGVISTMSWKQHLVFNAFFIILTTIAAVKYTSKNIASI
ncbi:MAG: hypothetical protein QM763_09465 [Agriterribacter sp.]